jgi:hypothetical protein
MTIVASGVCRMIIVKFLVIIVIIFNSRTACDWKTRREGFTHYLPLDTSLPRCVGVHQKSPGCVASAGSGLSVFVVWDLSGAGGAKAISIDQRSLIEFSFSGRSNKKSSTSSLSD